MTCEHLHFWKILFFNPKIKKSIENWRSTHFLLKPNKDDLWWLKPGIFGLPFKCFDRWAQVSVSELQTFVGYLGGVQKFFEQRRKRVTQSRKDVARRWFGKFLEMIRPGYTPAFLFKKEIHKSLSDLWIETMRWNEMIHFLDSPKSSWTHPCNLKMPMGKESLLDYKFFRDLKRFKRKDFSGAFHGQLRENFDNLTAIMESWMGEVSSRWMELAYLQTYQISPGQDIRICAWSTWKLAIWQVVCFVR